MSPSLGLEQPKYPPAEAFPSLIEAGSYFPSHVSLPQVEPSDGPFRILPG